MTLIPCFKNDTFYIINYSTHIRNQNFKYRVCLQFYSMFLWIFDFSWPQDNYSFWNKAYARIRFILFWLVNSSLTIMQLRINELLYTKEKPENRLVCSRFLLFVCKLQEKRYIEVDVKIFWEFSVDIFQYFITL